MTTTPHFEPRTQRSFRTVRLLGWIYLALSVLALAAIVLLRNDPREVNSTAWVRGSIVAATAVLLLVFVDRMAAGSRGAYRRLRFVSIGVPIGIAVIVAVPGMLPLWMRLEQGACGLLMIGVAFVVNGRHLRELFTPEPTAESVPPSTT